MHVRIFFKKEKGEGKLYKKNNLQFEQVAEDKILRISKQG